MPLLMSSIAPTTTGIIIIIIFIFFISKRLSRVLVTMIYYMMKSPVSFVFKSKKTKTSKISAIVSSIERLYLVVAYLIK